MKALFVLLIVAIPATTPEEWGALRVSVVEEIDIGFAFRLTYENDTGVELERVRVECLALDHRDRVVNSNSQNIDAVKVAERREITIRVRDGGRRSARAECRIAGGRR